jgi:hypothetical protein
MGTLPKQAHFGTTNLSPTRDPRFKTGALLLGMLSACVAPTALRH